MHDDPWKAALSRALVISQAGQLVKICTSGNICQWSCVGFGYRLHTPIGTWYPRLPTLFGESMFSFIPRIWSMIDFMFIILISASQILWRNRPEIQVFQVSATSFSWCKDRDESGVYPGWQCLGNVTFSGQCQMSPNRGPASPWVPGTNDFFWAMSNVPQ